MEKENKELDLFDLIKKVVEELKNTCTRLKSSFVKIFKFHLRYIYLLLAFVLVGVVAFYFLRKEECRTVNAEFTLQVNGTTTQNVADIVKVLDQSLSPSENNAKFAKLLNLPEESVAKIRKIDAFFFIDLNNNGTRDYVDYKGTFKEDANNSIIQRFLRIRIVSKGKSDYQLIQKHIVQYLLNDAFLKKEGVERRRMLKDNMEALKIEINTLDTLRSREIRSGVVLIQEGKEPVKKSSYFEDMLNLKHQLSNYTAEYHTQLNIVTIYSGVKVKAKRTDIELFLIYVGGMYVLGILLSLIFAVRKKMKS